MIGFWLPVTILACYGLVMVALARLAPRVQRRGAGSSVIGAFDEIWHPAGYRSRLEVRVHDERTADEPDPGDPPWTGRIRIPRP